MSLMNAWVQNYLDLSQIADDIYIECSRGKKSIRTYSFGFFILSFWREFKAQNGKQWLN